LVIDDVPTQKYMALDCVARSKEADRKCTVPASTMSAKSSLAVAAAQIASPNFEFLDLTSVFCDAALCYSIIGGQVVYVDTGHLAANFTMTLTEPLARTRLLGGAH
jgi:hypothetical protein